MAFLLFVLIQLPASWVLSQPSVKQLIEQPFNKTATQSNHIHILASRGTIWHGEVDLAIQTKITRPGKTEQRANSVINDFSIGTVNWNWQLSSLLLNKLAMELNWNLASSNLTGLVSTQIFRSQESRSVLFKEVTGKANLSQLSQTIQLPKLATLPVLQNLSGLVSVNQLNGVYILNKHWFTALDADLQVDNLSVMNNVFSAIKIETEFEKEKVLARISSQHHNWSLNGVGSLTQQLIYTVDFNLNTQSEAVMPDWAFLMRKKSATNYVSRLQGRL
ncbi:hypothetical protein JCM30760_03570 [Thiomicrorhabdus hydrogeniphila]